MTSRPRQDLAPLDPIAYDQLRERLLRIVTDVTPESATVAVVSKGDPRLVELEARRGWHFPRDADGDYAGFHPRASEDAIGHVEALRGAGARFLCLPATAFWWLDHYQGLAAWLESHCQVVVNDPSTCIVYDLSRPPESEPVEAEPEHAPAAAAQTMLESLLPDEALVLVLGPSADGLSAPGGEVEVLGTNHKDSLRRLASLQTNREAFILVPPLAAGDSLAPALDAFLARRTEPVARREQLGDLLRLRPTLGDALSLRASGSNGGAHRPGDTLDSPEATELAKRLARLGLPNREEER